MKSNYQNSFVCSCDVQHSNLELEKTYYKKSVAKTILQFLNKISNLLQDMTKNIEIMSGE